NYVCSRALFVLLRAVSGQFRREQRDQHGGHTPLQHCVRAEGQPVPSADSPLCEFNPADHGGGALFASRRRRFQEAL
ncbi:hypothetical protein AAVH_41855, partial [Aphelenchoides avenae]